MQDITCRCMQVSWWLPLGDNWPRLLITAGLIGAVSLLEAISIAKALAEVNGDHVNADQELLGEALWLQYRALETSYCDENTHLCCIFCHDGCAKRRNLTYFCQVTS